MKSSAPDSSADSPGAAAEGMGEVCIQYTAVPLCPPFPLTLFPLLHHGLQSFRNLPVWHFFTLSYPGFAQGATTLAVVEPLGLPGMGCVQPFLSEAPAASGHLHLVQAKISESTYIKVRKNQKRVSLTQSITFYSDILWSD